MTRLLSRTLCAAVLILLAAAPHPAWAQAAGRVTGVVTDPTGGVVPGVTVTLTAPGATSGRSTVTDAVGRFTFDNVAVGPYEVSYDLPGFSAPASKVTIVAGQTASVEARLTVGGQTEVVTVTGTLIPRPTLEAMSPVTTLDANEITYRGASRIEDLLQSLPQVFAAQNSTIANGASGTATIDLRRLGTDGTGSGRTLVLLDGRRLPPGDAFEIAPDLNFIPSALVKRVEILTGGASSVYGADAVSGVVNFVLDREFVGVRGAVNFAGYQHNNDNDIARTINTARGFTTPQGSIWNQAPSNFNVALGGLFGERRGHATVYLDYRDTPAITKDQRDYTNCSVQALGATGPACGGSATWHGGRFIVSRAPGNTTAPATRDLVIEPGTSNMRTRVGTDVYNFAPSNFMQRPDKRWTGGGFLNYEWNRHAEAYGDVMFMDDYSDAQIAPSGNFANTTELNCNNPMLTEQQRTLICTSMGYGPTDIASVIIQRRNVEGGGRRAELRHTAMRFSMGLRGDVNNAWRYDFFGLQGQVQSPQRYKNDFNSENIQEALLVSGTPGQPSTWACTSGNPECVPWNIFQANGVTPEALGFLQLPLILDSGTRSRTVQGTLTGNLGNYGVKLGSADDGIRLAFGGGYRSEFLFVEPDLAYRRGIGAGQGGPTLPVEGDYNVKEFFTEALLPLVQNKRGAQDVSLEFGYRYSDYSTTGSAPTWKIQGSYAPSADFKFRTGFNRATRSPNIRELFLPQGLGLDGSEDPCAGASPSASAEACERMGVSRAAYGNILENPAGQYNTLEGGNPDLNQEEADTWTAGFVVTPSAFPNFSATLDFYNIRVDSTIGSLEADDIVTQCAATGTPLLCDLVHRDRFGTLWLTPDAYTITTNQNVGKLESQGLDVNLSYNQTLGDAGTLQTNLMGTILMNQKVDTGLFAYDCVGLYGNQCGIPTPRWRHLFRAAWTSPFSTTFALGWRMVGKVENDDLSPNEALGDPTNVNALELNFADKIPVFNFFDLAVTHRLGGYNLVGGINNIFDKEPPLGAGASDNDFGPGFYGTYDHLGRYLFAGIQFNFQ